MTDLTPSAELQIDYRDDCTVLLTLDRPAKKNALSISLRDAVSDALDDLEQDESVRVVIITGAGSAFCSGFDLGEFSIDTPGAQERLWESSDRFHHRILSFPLPTISAVNGAALAGGFDLACLTDIRICADSATFGHPEQRWSTVLYSPLRDLVGGATARDLAFTGRTIDAGEAFRMGLVAQVSSGGELMDVALRRAQAIAAAPREALVATKAKVIAAAGVSPALRTLDL